MGCHQLLQIDCIPQEPYPALESQLTEHYEGKKQTFFKNKIIPPDETKIGTTILEGNLTMWKYQEPQKCV